MSECVSEHMSEHMSRHISCYVMLHDGTNLFLRLAATKVVPPDMILGLRSQRGFAAMVHGSVLQSLPLLFVIGVVVVVVVIVVIRLLIFPLRLCMSIHMCPPIFNHRSTHIYAASFLRHHVPYTEDVLRRQTKRCSQFLLRLCCAS